MMDAADMDRRLLVIEQDIRDLIIVLTRLAASHPEGPVRIERDAEGHWIAEVDDPMGMSEK